MFHNQSNNKSKTDTSPARSRVMRAIKSKGNKSTELKFRLALARSGMQGWKMHAKLVGSPDVYFPKYNLVIFLDGCFWHGCPMCGHIPKTNNEYWTAKIVRNCERDIKTTQVLKENGYYVIRFWEHDLKKNLSNCIIILEDFIEEIISKDIFLDELDLEDTMHG